MATSGIGFFGSILIHIGCGGVSMDQMGDRAANQALNEIFFGTGDQNYNYYANIQYPDPNNHANWAWPQYVSPGPSPDGIYNAHYGTKLSGQYASQTYQCSCSYGYAYNPNTGTCDPPTVTYVYDYATGAAWTAHANNYIAIYGTGFSTQGNNVPYIGGYYCSPTYQSATQINCIVASNTPSGTQQLQVANPGVGSAFSNVQVVAACTPSVHCGNYGYTCGQIWNGCAYETCGSYGGGCASGYNCNGNTCVAACTPYAHCSSYGYTCGQIWNGCAYETCGSYGGGCASGQSCNGNTCVGSSAPTISGEYNASTYYSNDARLNNYITVWGNGLSGCSYLYLGGVYQYISYTSPNQVNAYIYNNTYTGYQSLGLFCNGSWSNWWSVYVHY
jgi:hypothetical protein